MDGNAEATGNEEWGPFGRPLFSDPASRALSRVGVVDIGSNSVRLVVFDGAARSPAYFYNEKIMCALGAGLSETGLLNPEGRVRALSAIRRFQAIAVGMGIEPLSAVATAAVRRADDGPEFCAEVEAATGIKIHVIDGREEARLSAQGVLLGWPEAQGVICDIGGSSMELAEIGDSDVGGRVTSDLGPLSLREVKGGKKGRKTYINQSLEKLSAEIDSKGKRLFLVGGSWRAFARLDMERRNYPLHVLHEYRISPRDAVRTAKWIPLHDQAELCELTGTSAQRMELVPLAAEVLRQAVRILKPRVIAISSYGIREGLLYEQMPERLRAKDPLIEACRFFEAKDARLPGFGRSLFDFVMPLFPKVPENRKRIIRAACLLHDVSWRAHPDYRAEVCFEVATRANLGGMKHYERVYLGLALLHRYKNSREGSPFEQHFELLDAKATHQAEVLGKAMRLGAMFSVQMPGMLGKLRHYPKKKKLEMKLTPGTEDLFGEVAEARLNSLALTLGAEPVVKRQTA